MQVEFRKLIHPPVSHKVKNILSEEYKVLFTFDLLPDNGEGFCFTGKTLLASEGEPDSFKGYFVATEPGDPPRIHVLESHPYVILINSTTNFLVRDLKLIS